MWSFQTKLLVIYQNTTSLNMKEPWWLLISTLHGLPPHSSMISAIVLASSPAMMRMFFSPSRTTWTTWESFTDSRLQKGGITFCCTKYSTCQLQQNNQWKRRESGSESEFHCEWFIPDLFFHLLSSCWWPMQLPSVFQNHPVWKNQDTYMRHQIKDKSLFI